MGRRIVKSCTWGKIFYYWSDGEPATREEVVNWYKINTDPLDPTILKERQEVQPGSTIVPKDYFAHSPPLIMITEDELYYRVVHKDHQECRPCRQRRREWRCYNLSWVSLGDGDYVVFARPTDVRTNGEVIDFLNNRLPFGNMKLRL